MIRLIYFIPIWIVTLSLRTVIILFGLILIPIALLFKAYKYRASRVFTSRNIWTWKWSFMYPWGNEEDGILSGEEFLTKPTWFRMFYWTAIRNPANNLRYLPFFSCRIKRWEVKYLINTNSLTTFNEESKIVRYVLTAMEEGMACKSFWYLTWQGFWYSNFRIEFKMFGSYWRFWIGNAKIYPSDIYGVSETSPRLKGAGPVSQFKKVSS